MDFEYEFVEIIDSDDDSAIDVDSADYIVTEADDVNPQFGATGIIIEELKEGENVEEMESDDEIDILSLAPEVEEPEDSLLPLLNSHIEFVFKNEALHFEPPLRSNTSVRDLFHLARLELTSIPRDEELWFRFDPPGLEVGEENMHIHEPTIGHLLRLLNDDDKLKVEIESKASFYTSLKDLLKSLNLNTEDEGSFQHKKNKKQRFD